MSKVRWMGLDVHADTIAVAVAEDGSEVRSAGVIPNRPEAVRRLVKRVGGPCGLRVCYEAGPTGYVLYWQLAELGVGCEVVAPASPSSTSKRSGIRQRNRSGRGHTERSILDFPMRRASGLDPRH